MASKLSYAAAAILTLAASAQEDYLLEERIFLTSSHPEAGLINYLEMHEEDGDAKHLQ